MARPEPQPPRKRAPRRAVRKGTEDPNFRESDWTWDRQVTQQERDAEAERLRQEKPPHWS